MKSNHTSSRISALLAAAIVLLMVLVIVYKGLWQDADPETEGGPVARDSEAANHRHTDRSPRPRPQGPGREADRLLVAENVRTDVSLSEFPRKAYQHLPAPGGNAAGAPIGKAYIHVPSAGSRVALEANQIGEYPTMEAKRNETVGVRLSLDGVKSGTPVRVVILDGGGFPAAQGVTQVLEAGKGGGLGFEFTVSHNAGYHRILVQAQGQPSRILNFDAIDG